MLRLLFPPKCVLCRNLLIKNETDLCHSCRSNAPVFPKAKRNIPFIAHWTAMWYYKENVRKSIHRFKFGNCRSYADVYARLLALNLQNTIGTEFDFLTWVPVSLPRKFRRGYDQSKLVALALSSELRIPAKAALKKVRHTPPQSGLQNAAQRRANVLGAFQAVDRKSLAGKRILLIDDVVTTGATASECAKVLITSGAEKIYFAAVAAASDDKNK